MADVPWITAQPLILAELKDCPWPMAEQHLKVAAREFFRDTKCWGVWTDDMFTIAEMGEYIPYAGARHEVISVLECSVGTQAYAGANERDYGDAVTKRSSRNLAAWYNDALWLWPIPAADDLPIKAFIAVRPTMNSIGLPKEQYKFIDDIVCGAVAKLMAIPNRPYSDPTQALIKKQEFQRAKNRARSDAAKGGYAVKRVVGHYF